MEVSTLSKPSAKSVPVPFKYTSTVVVTAQLLGTETLAYREAQGNAFRVRVVEVERIEKVDGARVSTVSSYGDGHPQPE